ncbi:MAG TPA: hypothetical protein VEK15_12830 [Vicinamibacteria bacterium]|nr:hypothetical protein [Vicinamibacteria bacterium]
MYEVPLARHLSETRLLVGVVVIRWPGLDVAAVVERFEDAVEVGHRAEPEPGGIDRVHLGDTLLREVRRRSEAELLRLVEERLHDVGRIGSELQAVNPGLRRHAHPLARLLWRFDGALPLVERKEDSTRAGTSPESS